MMKDSELEPFMVGPYRPTPTPETEVNERAIARLRVWQTQDAAVDAERAEPNRPKG
jgi:hypothetical protein